MIYRCYQLIRSAEPLSEAIFHHGKVIARCELDRLIDWNPFTHRLPDLAVHIRSISRFDILPDGAAYIISKAWIILHTQRGFLLQEWQSSCCCHSLNALHVVVLRIFFHIACVAFKEPDLLQVRIKW